MNITITQDNSRIETLGSNGASIILKLYDLAIDSNNTLTLRGNISTAYAYGDHVDYLNTTYGPDLIVNATNRYITFADSAVLSALLAAGFGDGTGITEALAAVAELGETFKWNTSITSFPEFKYFTRVNTNLNSLTLYFRGCTNLTSIDLSMCEVLTEYEFVDSGLAIDVNVPRLVKANNQAFGGCNITKISNLGSITSIPSAFCIECNNLTEVTLPSTITSICPTGYGAFRNCFNLTTVRGLENVTTIGDLAFYQCYSLTFNELYLPNLVLLGSYAFFRCNKISKITCLGKLSTINSNAFETSSDDVSSLTEVYLPYECTTLDASAFNACKALTTIKLYTLSIDNWVEGETPLSSSSLRITSIGNFAFYSCTSLTSIDLSNVINIGLYAFCNTLLNGTISLPNLITISRSAFENTLITDVTNLGTVTEIPYACFYDCRNLTNVIIPTTVTKILGSAFLNSHLSKLILPYGVTELQTNFITGETGNYMTYVQIPSTLTKTSLYDIYRDSTNPVTAYIVIQATNPPNTSRDISNTGGFGLGWGWGDPRRARWYVPDTAVNDYKASDQWSVIADYIFPISLLETDSPTNWALYQANKDYGVPTNA